MMYTINVKYVPSYQIGKHFNLVYNDATGQVTFTKEEGTKFTNKQDVKNLLIDMIMNREKYVNLVEGSSYLEVRVMRGKEGFGYYDDQLTIKFK